MKQLFSEYEHYMALYGEAPPLVESNHIINKLIKIIKTTNYGQKQVGWIIKRIITLSNDPIQFIVHTPSPSEGFVLYKSSRGGLSTHTFGGRFNNDIMGIRYCFYDVSFGDSGWVIRIQLSRYTKKGRIRKYIVHSREGYNYEV